MNVACGVLNFAYCFVYSFFLIWMLSREDALREMQGYEYENK